MTNYREAKYKISYRIYFGWISSFSGEHSCAYNVQEVGSQKKPGRVVVRLSMCSNICKYVRKYQFVSSTRIKDNKLIQNNINP